MTDPESLPMAPGKVRLSGASRLPLGSTQVFPFMRRGYAVEGFLIHHEGGFCAFLNQCQHWPIPLDFGDGEFFDAALGRIRCKTHGAVYRPDSGLCEAGPCQRAHLVRYAVDVEGDDLIVHLTEA